MKKNKVFLAFILAGFFVFNTNIFAADSYLKPVVSIEGVVNLENENIASSVEIFVLNVKGEKIGVSKVNSIDGTFFITGLKPGVNYSLMFTGKKIETKIISIATPPADVYTEISQNFYVSPKSDSNIMQSRKM